MPTNWSDTIVLANLSDEPELSEEFAAIFGRLSGAEEGGAPSLASGSVAVVPHVVLDFAGVSYLNSSHIAQLLRMRKRLGEQGRTLVLCALGDDLWSVMTLTGLDKVFRFAPDTMTALAGLQIEGEQGEG